MSNQPVPDEWARAYPMMRQSAAFDDTGRTTQWRIISAASKLTVQELQNTVLFEQLSPEQKHLSIFEMWPHSVMVRELVRGWTPEKSEELRFEAAVKAAEQEHGQKAEFSVGHMRQFLYFSKKTDAEEAGKRLRSRGFSVEISDGVGGEEWLVLVTTALPKTGEQMDELRDEMSSLAVQFGGEYDGWEAPLESPDSESAGKGQRIN